MRYFKLLPANKRCCDKPLSNRKSFSVARKQLTRRENWLAGLTDQSKWHKGEENLRLTITRAFSRVWSRVNLIENTLFVPKFKWGAERQSNSRQVSYVIRTLLSKQAGDILVRVNLTVVRNVRVIILLWSDERWYITWFFTHLLVVIMKISARL